MTGISLLGSEIGRGHPFYSDGLLQALREAGAGDRIVTCTDVFRVSSGPSLAAWKSVGASYRIAGRGGPVAHVYHRVRRNVDYDRDSLMLRVLGADLKRWADEQGIVVVDHPAVVGALGGRADIWYIHGEMVAPPEAVVRRAARVFVPREETAGEFLRGGLHPEQVLVTGLCVENALVDGAFEQAKTRRERIAAGGPLTVAFFSSGAEPAAHVRVLAEAARAVAASHHAAVVFAKEGGRLEAAVGGGVEAVSFRGRADLDERTTARFASFDAVVSPPHERCNWAVGLGVPFFFVGPDIGPFAPRNRDLLLRSGVAAEIHGEAEARSLPARLDSLRAGGLLLRMSEMGAGVPVDGFRRAARMLIEELERRAPR